MFTRLFAGVVLLVSVSSAFADWGGRGFDRGGRYSGGSRSSISFGFGFSSGGYRGSSSYFDVGFSSGRRYDNFCSTPSYYYAPRPTYYCEPQTVIIERPRYYERPVYVSPAPVYVAPPAIYEAPPVVVYPSRSYYYQPCAPSGDIYYRSTSSYYYGR